MVLSFALLSTNLQSVLIFVQFSELRRAVALAITVQKTGDPAHCFCQIFCIGQKHNPEMVRRNPVEAGSLHDQHFLFDQQFLGEILIIDNRIHLWIESREHI